MGRTLPFLLETPPTSRIRALLLLFLWFSVSQRSPPPGLELQMSMCKPHHRLAFPNFQPTSMGAPARSWNTASTILSTERHRRWSPLNAKNHVAASWTQTLLTNDIIQGDWWRPWLITKVRGLNTPRHRHDWSLAWGWEGRVLTALLLDGLWAELLIIILRIT